MPGWAGCMPKRGTVVASDITLAAGDGAPGSMEVYPETDPRPPDSGSPRRDTLTATAIQTLSQAIEMLREDLGTANRRIDELLMDLANARTAAMIRGCEVAALRSQLALLTNERPRWRGWFR